MISIYRSLNRHSPRLAELLRYGAEYIQVLLIDTFTRLKLAISNHAVLGNKKNLSFHFGCGSNIKKDYVNVDIGSKADIRIDLRKELPFSDRIAARAYTEHFVEHLAYPEEVDLFFSEVYRILKPGGEFKISVPDASIAIKMISKDPQGTYAEFSKTWHADWCKTDYEHLNYLFRQRTTGMSYLHFECHRFAYDFTTLKSSLERAGFTEIKLRSHEPDLDQDHHKHESLRVSALKPDRTEQFQCPI